MVTFPAAMPVVKPALLTVAIVLSLEVQTAVLVITLVVPFEYVPVATNCCVRPTPTVAVAGVIATDVMLTT